MEADSTGGAAGGGGGGGAGAAARSGAAAAPILPNLLICGTPGTGKSTLASAAAARCGLRWLVVGDAARARGLHAGASADAAWEGALLLDGDAEDALVDALEPALAAGGVVLEHHTVDWFPERWFARVLVLRADNGVLFDRLAARGYGPRKIEENVCAEIMCVVAEEARDSYAPARVHELPSNSLADLDAALAHIEDWLAGWHAEREAAAARAAAGGAAPLLLPETAPHALLT